MERNREMINILITGATGVGKSSTINALANGKVAKVGTGVDPETMDIMRYDLDNLTLWDSPGLGDGKAADIRHSKNIIEKLNERDNFGNLLIDLVIVIIDGSSRDLGTSYELINNLIIPNLGKNAESKLLVAINQADMAMKGRYWNCEHSLPDETLIEFLNEKAASVKRRIKEATNLDISPIYYSAGYTDGDEQCRGYNLSKIHEYIETISNRKVTPIASEVVIPKKKKKKKNRPKDTSLDFIETIIDSSILFNPEKSLAGRAVNKVLSQNSLFKNIIKSFW